MAQLPPKAIQLVQSYVYSSATCQIQPEAAAVSYSFHYGNSPVARLKIYLQSLPPVLAQEYCKNIETFLQGQSRELIVNLRYQQQGSFLSVEDNGAFFMFNEYHEQYYHLGPTLNLGKPTYTEAVYTMLRDLKERLGN